MQDLNHVSLIGRLTRDPELNPLPSGSSVCNLRIANTKSVKQGDSWEEAPNYFDVTVWGRLAEIVGEHLSKGSQLAVHGRLDWREWEARDGSKRQSVSIVARDIQFIGAKVETVAPPVDTAESVQADAEPAEIPF